MNMPGDSEDEYPIHCQANDVLALIAEKVRPVEVAVRLGIGEASVSRL